MDKVGCQAGRLEALWFAVKDVWMDVQRKVDELDE